MTLINKQLFEGPSGREVLMAFAVTAAGGKQQLIAPVSGVEIRVKRLIQSSTASNARFVSNNGTTDDYTSSLIPLNAQIECKPIFETKMGSGLYINNVSADCEFGLLIETFTDPTGLES